MRHKQKANSFKSRFLFKGQGPAGYSAQMQLLDAFQMASFDVLESYAHSHVTAQGVGFFDVSIRFSVDGMADVDWAYDRLLRLLNDGWSYEVVTEDDSEATVLELAA